VIVVLTDGADNRSHRGLEQAADHALYAESVIYIVNTTSSVMTEQDKRADRAVNYLADSTGGAIFPGTSERDVEGSFGKIDEELRSQYVVSYRPHQLVATSVFRIVKVLGPKGVRIRCRAGYYPR
jgi:Ca-activated chloride channel family protein